MFIELIENSRKIEEKVKAMKSELKGNVQGTNSDGKETRTQINGLDQKEELNIQPEQSEKTRIQQNQEKLKNNIQDNFKCSNICIIRMPEEEEEQQKIGNICKHKEGKLP